jgi:hypothetical protein
MLPTLNATKMVTTLLHCKFTRHLLPNPPAPWFFNSLLFAQVAKHHQLFFNSETQTHFLPFLQPLPSLLISILLFWVKQFIPPEQEMGYSIIQFSNQVIF